MEAISLKTHCFYQRINRSDIVFNFVRKLQFYPRKKEAFLEGTYEKTLSTVMLYLSSGICNHDCVYCDKRFYNIHPVSFDLTYLKRMIDDMKELEADSLIILGEGAEPLLHPNLCDLIDYATDRGIACGIYTNGSIYSEDTIKALKKMDFVRISLDAGSVSTHSKIHKYAVTRNDFDNALSIFKALSVSSVNTGASFIIMDDNIHEIYDTWELMNKLGVSFLELKLPLEAGYVFSNISSYKMKLIESQIRLISNNQKHFKTKVVLNNHLQALINGDVSDASKLTLQNEEPCMTCAFRVVVSPLGYFQCSPRKNTEAALFGNPFEIGLKEAWISKKHKSMIGAPCSICCTYSKQNTMLNRILDGKIEPEQDSSIQNCTTIQKNFL